jgi:hypothetical protein
MYEDSAPFARSADPRPSRRIPRLASRRLRVASLIAGSFASMLLVACGQGQRTSTGVPAGEAGRRTPAGAANAGSSRRPVANTHLTAARAVAFARAVNLTAADIPGARIVRRSEGHGNPDEQRQLRRCGGTTRPGRKLTETPSPKFTRGAELESEEIRSYVTVLANGRPAVTEFAPLERAVVRECVARILTRRFAEKAVREARWGRFSVSRLPVQAPGADATIGVRVATTLTLTFSEVSVPIYFDVLGFASGPAAVAVSAVSVTQPAPAATEARLLSLLLARADAHPL